MPQLIQKMENCKGDTESLSQVDIREREGNLMNEIKQKIQSIEIRCSFQYVEITFGIHSITV